MFLEEAIRELSIYLGLPPTILLIVLASALAVGFGCFISLSFGTRWGMALGLVPVVLGAFIGLFPVWIVFICAIPGMFVVFGSLFGRDLQTSEDEEEVDESTETAGVSGIPQSPPKSKSNRKPPWAI